MKRVPVAYNHLFLLALPYQQIIARLIIKNFRCRVTMNFWLTMNCLVHVWLYAAAYFLSLHNYFSFITVLVCVAHSYSHYQFIITRFTQYSHKSLHWLYKLPHVSRRYVYLHSHTVCTSKFLHITFPGNVFLGNVCPGNILYGKCL